MELPLKKTYFKNDLLLIREGKHFKEAAKELREFMNDSSKVDLTLEKLVLSLCPTVTPSGPVLLEKRMINMINLIKNDTT